VHDADYYRNPRRAEELRAELARSPATTATADALERGASALEEEIVALA
jgi:hypothetical protein